ncbi:MAG: hypothetical protein IIB38_16420 [Candidatus Hydrogenedentes bacterium]|nr:hypothetical protein [Candidatus Hydrogenedentota bacterium]
MLTLKKFACCAGALMLCVTLTGCQTYGESAGLGAILGATAGAIIGNQSGHSEGGAVVGAAIGAIGGAIVHDVNVQREEEMRQHQAHRPDPVLTTRPSVPKMTHSLVLEESSVLPSRVRRGSMVEASIQYALTGGRYGTRVTEVRELMRDGKVVERFFSKSEVRENGSWVSAQQFRVSEHLEPGEYTVVQTISSRDMTVSASSTLTVN